MSGSETAARTAFGQMLRRCRHARGLSQEELGERAGVGVRTIADLERGRATRPYRQTVRALGQALGMDGSQLEEFARLSRPARQPVPNADEAVPEDPGRRDMGDPDRHETRPAASPPANPGTASGQPVALAVPRQLPAPVSHFTGRTDELDALALSLGDTADPRTVVITALAGTAGVGKTALAVHWAHHVAERFPDGQLYVNLRGYDPAEPLAAGESLARFLRALGVRGPDIPTDDEERGALYRSMLAGRRMLVVLDNARDAEQVRPLLPGTPASAAVVTSRDTLTGLVARDGAGRLHLDLLPLPDAIALLRSLIGSRVETESDAAAALATSCGRLPLALRIAAEMAVAHPAATLGDLAAELAGHQHRLDLLGAGEDPRTAVRAVFSWSLRYLDPDALRAFRLAGIHRGPDLDVYAAAALTGSSLQDVGRALELLARANLVQPGGPGRFSMHDLLRDYAGELAAEDADAKQAAMTRLFDYYLHAAAAAINILYPAEEHMRPVLPHQQGSNTPALAGPGAAGAWLEAERPNLLAVITHAAEDSPRHAIDLAGTIFRYLDSGGYVIEAVTAHRQAIGAARQTGDASAEARAVTNLAGAEVRQGHDEDATTHLREALALSRQAGDHACEARALGNLGVLATYTGSYEQAATYQELGLALRRKTGGDRTGEVTGLCNLACAQIMLGRLSQASGNLQQALALARHIGDQDGEMYALASLGDICLRRHHFTDAQPILEQSLTLARITGHRIGEAAALAGLGEASLRQGNYPQATDHLHSALILARQAGARAAENDALTYLGEIALATGDHEQARSHYAEALTAASRAGDANLQARAHCHLGENFRAVGDSAEARHHWQRALDLYTHLGAAEADEVRSQLNGL